MPPDGERAYLADVLQTIEQAGLRCGWREALGEAGRAGTGRYGVDQDAFGGEGSFTHVE